MNKKTIIAVIFALVAMTGQGQVKCHVVGTVAEGTTSVELRIYRDGEELFAEAQKMAQLRYKTNVRKTQEDWSE